jgi:hypothetical protein
MDPSKSRSTHISKVTTISSNGKSTYPPPQLNIQKQNISEQVPQISKPQMIVQQQQNLR